jgi:hypothetical protein
MGHAPQPTPHEQMRAHIEHTERRLAETFEQDAGTELALADDAAALLTLVMSRVGERTATVTLDPQDVPVGGDTDALRLYALQIMGARALRVIRAARATLMYGYEGEVGAQDRILVELLVHRAAVLNDKTRGRAAFEWLRGRGGGQMSNRVAKMTASDVYANLSHDSHADAMPIARLLDAETQTLSIEPRRTAATRASLLMHAGFARDQTIAIAKFAGIQLEGVDRFDEAIDAAWARLIAEHDAASTDDA